MTGTERVRADTEDAASGETRADDAPSAGFVGHRRPDGRLGVRNRVLVLPSVICSHRVAEAIADRADSAVAAPHDHGCGQLGADSEQTERVLENVAANPNVAGTLVVGLGCEEVQSDAVAAAVADRGLPVREVAIQDAGGTDACIERGVAAVENLADHTNATADEPGSLGDLTVGIVVGDIHLSTVEHAHPLLAALIKRVVAAGGSVAVAGSERVAAHPTSARAVVAEDATDALDRLLDRHAGRPSRATGVWREADARGSEASLGFLDDATITDVFGYGDRVHDDPVGDGLDGDRPRADSNDDGTVALIDAPSRFEEAATGLATAGAHIVVHTTAHGVPAGHPIVPVLKLSGHGDTLDALSDDIDVDARTATPDELEERLLAAANGDQVRAEHHGLTEFAITRIGPSI